jgi:hypothetical protein
MKRAAVCIIVCLLLAAGRFVAAQGNLPLIDGRRAIATVNGEPVTSAELRSAIKAAHAKRAETEKAGKIDYTGIMNRLISTRLIVIEARNMGLDELVEIRKAVDSHSKDTLSFLLFKEQVRDVTPDEGEVERFYQEIVKEWKITSVMFEKEDAAKQFKQTLEGDKDFDEAAKEAMGEGLAKEVDWGNYLKNRELTRPIARLVSRMEVGSVSPIVSLEKRGFIVFRLEGMRIPEEEDQEAKKQAKQKALNQKKLETARAYYRELREKSAKIDENLFAALDYESSEPGFAKLLKDKRVIVEIKGEEPITVGDLGEALNRKFYHGIERAIENKKVNKQKKNILETMIERKLLLQEALKQNIDKTQEYIDRVNGYEMSLLFGAFINKVIAPGIQLDIKELKTYYKDNHEEYTLPQMMRIKTIVFSERNDAIDALNKLRRGTDFNWLSSRAEKQVDKKGEGVLNFEGKLLTVRSLPEDVRQVLSEAKPGDYRFYESSEGPYYYVLYVYHVIPAEPQPFENVRKEIAKKVFDEKVKEAVEDYAQRLKEYYPVKIYAKDLQ